MPAPRPEPSSEATREAAKRGRLRSRTRAFIAGASAAVRRGPSGPAPPDWSGRGRAAPRRSSGPEGEQGLAAALGLVPGLDVPPPPAGDGGQLGLGVDGHREADGLEHGQVAGRVGVGHRLLEPEALGLGVVGQHQGPGLADGRQRLEPAGELAVLHAELGADDLVEQRPERLDHEVEGPGDEDRSGGRGPGGPGPGRCPTGKDLASSRWWKRSHPSSRSRAAGRPLVAAVEGAEEVAPVAAVEGEQRGRLGQEVGDEGGPLGRRAGAGTPARRRSRRRWRR